MSENELTKPDEERFLENLKKTGRTITVDKGWAEGDPPPDHVRVSSSVQQVPSPVQIERNAIICRLYMSGLTLRQVGEHFGLSSERVRQILREAGVYKTDRKKEARLVRDKFLGVNISEGNKVALALEAERRGLSMSALTAEWIREKLAALPAATLPLETTLTLEESTT